MPTITPGVTRRPHFIAMERANADPGPPMAAWLATDTVGRSRRASHPKPYTTAM